jgi:phosphoglycolate phosphatase
MDTKPKKSLLITDMDNTLFDWFEFWFNSFNSLIEKTSEISGIEKSKLCEEIRPIHQKYGTSEYSFVLQEIPSLLEKYKTPEKISLTLDEAIHAYRSARKDHLQLYEGVFESLRRIKDNGAKIAAYTESRYFYSAYRIKHFNLDGIIDVLFSPDDHRTPGNIQTLTPMSLEKTKVELTPEGELKPNPHILRSILEYFKESKDNAVYVGDSEMKDISMAQDAGVDDVLAAYGAAHFSGNSDGYELLRSVSHWSDADVEREKEIKRKKGAIKESYRANHFSEIFDYFDFGNQT